MKNSSKNNYSGKNSNKHKINSNSNFYSKKTNTSKNKNRISLNSSKNKSVNDINESDINRSNFSSLIKRKMQKNKSNSEFNSKAQDIYPDITNKKNFDDWIWGKHSVFEALISGRAINRIWCTSEIFSSEKFYILLKDLKSKGVLIEEVSWNRL